MRTQVVVVVAGKRHEPAAVEFDDARGEAADQRAVVRDEDRRTLKREEHLFERRDGVDVHVVGRLVEQQHVRIRHEGARQHDAAPGTAGAGADDDVGGQGKPAENLLDPLREVPSAERVDALLQRGQALQRRVVAVCDGVARVVIVGQHFAEFRKPAGHGLIDRGGKIFRHVLFQMSDAQRVAPPHAAFVGQHRAADDVQQRRLPGAVAADETDAFAFFELEVRAIEQHLVAERERGVVQRDEAHGVDGSSASIANAAASASSSAARITRRNASPYFSSFVLPTPRHAEQLGCGARPHGNHLGQRRVVEDHIRRHALSVGQLFSARAQRAPQPHVLFGDRLRTAAFARAHRRRRIFTQAQRHVAAQQGSARLREHQRAVSVDVGAQITAHEQLADHRAPLCIR